MGTAMIRRIMTTRMGLWALLLTVGAGEVIADVTVTTSELTVEQMVQRIQTAGQELTSFQATLAYEVNQPEMESCQLRKGSIAYQRDPNQSNLRVDFNTLQQDDMPEEICKEIFYFDGIWLNHLNYDVKSLTQRQMTPEDQAADAFELAGQSMPLVGFTDMGELARHFDLSPVELGEQSPRLGLLLEVKPDSDYSKEYTQLTFEIDPQWWLPTKVVAIAPVGDVHTIIFTDVTHNQPIDPNVFLVKVPLGFDKEVIPPGTVE